MTLLVPIKKELGNGKKFTYKLKFIDGFRFSQPHSQLLLVIYLKFKIKNQEHVKKEKLTQYAILTASKMINYITNAANVRNKS